MLVTVERPTGLQVAGRAWRSIFSAVRQMIPLFIGSVLLLMAWNVAYQWLIGLLPWPSITVEMGSRAADPQEISAPLTQGLLVGLLYVTVRVIALAPIAVAVHRFILLNEARKAPFFINRLTLRFAVWMALFEIAWTLIGQLYDVVPSLILAVPKNPDIMLHSFFWWLIGLANLILMPVIVLRTMLLFPAVAVEEQNGQAPFARLKTATSRAKGSFWMTLIATVLALLPVFVFWNAVLLAPHYAFGVRADTMTAPLIGWLYSTGESAVAVLMVALMAATASWLYSHAAQNSRPADQF